MENANKNRLGGYGRSVIWLRKQGLNTQQIANVLDTSDSHVRQLDYRGQLPRTSREIVPAPLLVDSGITTPPRLELRKFLGIREEEDSVAVTVRSQRDYGQLRAEIESRASGFWNTVRYEAGIQHLRLLLPRVGYPAQSGRIRLRARIHELCAEMFLHSGSSAFALQEGLRSYHLYGVAYHESRDKCDIDQMGRLARLLSQVFLLRREDSEALSYLEIHKALQERLGRPSSPEYHRQLASLAFKRNNSDSDLEVKTQSKIAMNKLSETVANAQPSRIHEVKDIGERLLPLLLPLNWDASEELCHGQLRSYPRGDIHIGLNVANTAACGLSTDHQETQLRALTLLYEHDSDAIGYRRLESTFALLKLTPKLPKRLRREWTRFALYENVYDNRSRFPRYTNSGG